MVGTSGQRRNEMEVTLDAGQFWVICGALRLIIGLLCALAAK